MTKAFKLGAIALLAGIASLPALAADVTIRLSIDVPEGNPKYVAAQQFAAAVAEGTDNAVEVRVFGNSLLGGEAESAEGIRLGSIQAGIITSSVFANWIPEIQVLDLPFLFRNDDHVTAANALLTETFEQKFADQGFHLLGFSINGARQLMSSFPISEPADLAGKKMRVIQSPIHVALWQAVGANPVPIPAPEVYNAMQTRVVDLFDNTPANYYSLRFYEVAPHYIDLSHVYAMGTWVLDQNVWNRLSEEQQAVITEAAFTAQADLVALQQEEDRKALADAEAAGSTLHTIEDKQVWVDLMQPVYDEFAPSIPGAAELIEHIQAIN